MIKIEKPIGVHTRSYDLKYAAQIATPVFDYKIPFGKHKNNTFLAIPDQERKNYVRWLAEKSRNVTSMYATAFLLGKLSIGDLLEDSLEKNVLKNPFFLVFGKYRGIPLQMVENESPGYCAWLLKSDFSKNLDDELKHVIQNFTLNNQ